MKHPTTPYAPSNAPTRRQPRVQGGHPPPADSALHLYTDHAGSCWRIDSITGGQWICRNLQVALDLLQDALESTTGKLEISDGLEPLGEVSLELMPATVADLEGLLVKIAGRDAPPPQQVDLFIVPTPPGG